VRTAATGALGRYPAFDCTPPDLVTGLITPRGVIAPYDIRSVFGAA
jgi:methylthioribose-1-phosphate isomerase